ncbi:MAG: glycosyltransferase family 4 protein [Muribaculaceae bacterium]|nr:glycosyltransferase family 4 protein [Muribaculaceae bacterium]
MEVWFDNIIFSLQKAGGISNVWQNLLANVGPYVECCRFLEYKNSSDNIFRRELDIDPGHIRVQNFFNPVLSQFQRCGAGSDRPFVFHSSYFRLCSNPQARIVTTVHDFIYEQNPRPSLKQRLRMKLNYLAIQRSHAIVCVSEHTRRDLLRYLPETDPRKVHVIHNGVSEDYHPLDAIPYQQYRNTVLFVGGRQYYKNFDFVVKALGSTEFNLLVCGAPLSGSETAMLDEYLPGRYSVVPYPSNAELNRILNSVHALVYPSSYEGFGLPILEAQRAGCPVVALDASSVPEIIGSQALLMPSLTPESLVELLYKLKDSDLRRRIVRAGIENVRRFSWQKMACAYVGLYRTLLNN